jgi:hypothetical protein
MVRMSHSAELVAWHGSGDVNAVALLLPGGAMSSHGRYWKFLDIGLRTLARTLVKAQRPAHPATARLRPPGARHGPLSIGSPD